MASFEHTIRSRYSCRDFSSHTVPRALLDRLLGAAQGITHADGKRSVPSASSLYSLKLFAIAGRIRDLDAAAYTFDPETAPAAIHDHVVADMAELQASRYRQAQYLAERYATRR